MPALASSPRMIGRGGELATLLEAFADAQDGRPRTVVVRGEAGIGKTRLVQEFLAAAVERARDDLPVVVAVGQCVDLGPIGAPFGPVRRALRDLHAAVGADALRDAAGSPAVVAALAALVPGIGEDPADEHAGGFAEAIEIVLETLSADRHVIVVIEDLQWADAATLALLKTLASSLRGRHLTIVATYRSDDVDRFHPLRPVIAELDRIRTVVRVEIVPLSADEVAQQVIELAVRELDAAQVRALAERSGGIPFLVEELVDLGDAQLPDTLRDLVLARYARLGDAGQQAVRAMAAGGMHVDHDVLTAVAALDDDTLDGALREAVDARVVLAEGEGYAFRHALTREAVDGEMLPSERVRVHRRYAEHLAAHRAGSPEAVSAIAEHWLAARDLTAAFDATVAALDQSRATFAPATSVKLAERLVELWDQVPEAAARSGTTLPQLHLAAAQAWHELGDPERALRSAQEGLAVPDDDPLVRAALLRRRFVQEFNAGRHPDRADLHEVVALLEGIDDPEARVLLSRTLTNLAIEDREAKGTQHLDRAIALAEELGDDPALAVALTNLSWRISDGEDDEPRALAHLERAMALPVDPAMRAYVGEAYIGLLSRLGRFDEAALVGRRLHADAARAGIERGTAASIALGVAHALFSAGDPDTAVSYAQRARRLLDREGRATAVRLLATHYAWNDEPETRHDLLTAERPALDAFARRHPKRREWWTPDAIDSVLAPNAREADATARAERIASIAAAVRRGGSPPARRFAAIAGALVVRSSAGTRDAAETADLREAITAALDAWPERGAAAVQAAFVRATLADADAAPASQRAAAWRTVVDAASDGVLPVRHRHLARLALAEVLIESGEREEASALLETVVREAPVHGVARAARRAAELAAQAGLTSGPRRAAGAAGIDALTARERQVLALVAEGLTNPQIGERLYISRKTASVHVSAILAKIGASTRAEAAALFAASENGHLRPEDS